MKPNNIKKIGIIKLGSIGDIIHTLPAAYILRENYPNARIDWIVEKKSLEVLTGNRYIDNIVVIDTKAWRRNPFAKSTVNAITSLIRFFKDASYDVVFDFQGLIKSGIITYLTKAPKRIGFNPKECREYLNRIFMNMNTSLAGEKNHVVKKNLNLLKTLDIDVSRVEFPFALCNGDEKPIADFFEENSLSKKDFIAAVDPSAGWETKCIDLEILSKVVDYLTLSKGCKVVIMWGPGEHEKALEIKLKCKSNPLVLCKTNLKNLAAFLKRCNLMLSPDTGPMHLAAAFGVKCIGVYGPTCPYKNGPYGDKNLFVSRFVDCSPCYKRTCSDLKCMDSITFEDIKEKIDLAIINI
ncbi:glycosyltransferase family 9 protein [bacterium]|nr:glycosyltransferase family 9 protein [bacterium]